MSCDNNKKNACCSLLIIFASLFIVLALILIINSVPDGMNAEYLNSTTNGTQEVDSLDPIVFELNQTTNGNAISHIPGSPTFEITESGAYLVTFNSSVSRVEGQPLILVSAVLNLNGTNIPATLVTVNPDAPGEISSFSFQIIIEIPAGETGTLQVINASTGAANFIDPNINIIKIADI